METLKTVKSERAAAPAEPARTEPTSSPAASAPPTRPRGKRPFVILGIAAVLVLGAVLAYRSVTANDEGTDDAQVAADIVSVGARVGGAVARVHVRENQVVKKGEPLVDLDDADLAARVQQAEAELATAEAQAAAANAQVEVVSATSKGGLASARAALQGSSVGIGTAEAQLAAARAALTRAQTDARRAELDLQRARELRQANAVPQERLDNAQLASDASKAALAQAEAQVALGEETKRGAQSRVGEARGRLSQSAPVAPQIAAATAQAALGQARVRSAQAALALTKLQLSYTKIVAPSDGVASKITVREGQLVSAGQPVVEIVPAQTYLVANFKETQIGRMKPGDPAEIELDAFPGRTLHGRIESLAGGTGASFSLLPPDNATGNFVKVVQRVPVRIGWIDPPGDITLRAGLSADVTVRVGK